MKKVFVRSLVSLVLVCFLLSACATPAATTTPVAATQPEATVAAAASSTEPASAKKEYNIAIIRWQADDIYFNGVQMGEEQMRDSIQTQDGVKINFNVFAANDAAKQVVALQQMMDAGNLDGVIINAWDGTSMVSLIEDLNKKGIPVVTNNGAVPGGKSAFVAFGNYEAGVGGANYVVKRLEELKGADWVKTDGGVIIELRCILTLSADIGRHNGYRSVLDPIVAANPNLSIQVTEAGCDGAKARKFVDDQISRYGNKILAIVSIDGTMGVGGAVPALDAQGMLYPADDPRHIVIGTIDGTQVELQAINKGDIDVSYVQPAVGEGSTAVKVLWDMIKSGKQFDTPTADSTYLEGSEPWEPVIETSDSTLGYTGPWFKLNSYGVPVDRKVDDASNWGNMMYTAQNGSAPVYDGAFGK